MTNAFYSGEFQVFYIFRKKKVENFFWESMVGGAYAADNSIEYPGLTQQVNALHNFIVRSFTCGITTNLVVKFFWSVKAHADKEIIFSKETDPFRSNENGVCLKKIFYFLSLFLPCALNFHCLAIEF